MPEMSDELLAKIKLHSTSYTWSAEQREWIHYLLAEIERLQQERDAWKLTYDEAVEIIELKQQRLAAAEKVLSKGLIEHSVDCGHNVFVDDSPPRCTCGLENALSEWQSLKDASDV